MFALEAIEKNKFGLLFFSFPALETARGLRIGAMDAAAFSPDKLDEWAYSAGKDPQNIQAVMSAQFILWVWNPTIHWLCGPFILRRALEHWDHNHRQAFMDWGKNPFWVHCQDATLIRTGT